MQAFVSFTGEAAVLDRKNVDTDQIIPKQFLKRVERTGFGKYLFYDWRFENGGTENQDFELNQPGNKDAEILITGENFGCGSSREHAPWALFDYGFRVIIAPSFADIFYNNCLKNGLLPIVLNEEKIKLIKEKVSSGKRKLAVDLENQKISDDYGNIVHFETDEYWKNMLLEGKDEIALTLDYGKQIESYEQTRLS